MELVLTDEKMIEILRYEERAQGTEANGVRYSITFPENSGLNVKSLQIALTEEQLADAKIVNNAQTITLPEVKLESIYYSVYSTGEELVATLAPALITTEG